MFNTTIDGNFLRKEFNNNMERVFDMSDRFIKQCNESILCDDYDIVHSYKIPTDKDEVIVSHALFSKNGDLVALVDFDPENDFINEAPLDDIIKFLPTGVKLFVFDDSSFIRQFEDFVRLLRMDYDQYVNSVFESCRNSPFPYPMYKPHDMIRDMRNLIDFEVSDLPISTRYECGLKLIKNFHKSIYKTSVAGSPSIYDAWHDDELLKKVIINRTLYRNNVDSNKVLQGFNVSKIAPKPSVLLPIRAKIIINEYLMRFDTIFDPEVGFSGKMLAAMSLKKKYIGVSSKQSARDETADIINFITRCKANFPDIVMPEILDKPSGNKFDALFAYIEPQNMELKDIESDIMIDGYLKEYECKCYVFITRGTIKYRKNVKDVIENNTHFYHNSEVVIVLGTDADSVDYPYDDDNYYEEEDD